MRVQRHLDNRGIYDAIKPNKYESTQMHASTAPPPSQVAARQESFVKQDFSAFPIQRHDRAREAERHSPVGSDVDYPMSQAQATSLCKLSMRPFAPIAPPGEHSR